MFKLGSLGTHGDFSLCSDVDIAIMLDNILESDADVMNTLWEKLKKSKYDYANRLSVFWSSYHTHDFANGKGRFPALDRLDFIRHAVILSGEDRRYRLPEPTAEDLIIESAEFMLSYMLSEEKRIELTRNPQIILEKGSRYFTKFVLFPVRLIFTIDYPNTIGSNKDAVNHFNQSWKIALAEEVSEIINVAYKLRNTDPNQVVDYNVEQIKIFLPRLYLYCLNRYHKAIADISCSDDEKKRLQEKIRAFKQKITLAI
ncbi:MAG: hypothetical protein AAGA27_01675 [Pseudomonadota bacterium]